MAFRKKKSQILQYEPDILVIQECENPEMKGDWSVFSDWLWIGDNEHKGLGVFSRNNLSLELADVEGPGGRYAIPVTTDGSVDVLGVWAMNDEKHPERRYIGQVYTALQDHREFLNHNTVVVGDFNWNLMWDKSLKSPLCGNFDDTVDILYSCGLHSSYHTLNDTNFGNESIPTFFMHKKRDREYHIDYIFIPDRAVESVAEFSIGSYENWIDASDHMPIMIEM